MHIVVVFCLVVEFVEMRGSQRRYAMANQQEMVLLYNNDYNLLRSFNLMNKNVWVARGMRAFVLFMIMCGMNSYSTWK